MKAKRQSKGQVAQRLLQEVTHLAFHSDQITTFNLGIGIWCFLSLLVADRRRGGGGETFVQSSKVQLGRKDLLSFFCIVIHWKISINCSLAQARVSWLWVEGRLHWAYTGACSLWQQRSGLKTHPQIVQLSSWTGAELCEALVNLSSFSLSYSKPGETLTWPGVQPHALKSCY